jgi:hypothetical protein
MAVRIDGDFSSEEPLGAKLLVGALGAAILAAASAAAWWAATFPGFYFRPFVAGVFFMTAFILAVLVFAVIPACCEAYAAKHEER